MKPTNNLHRNIGITIGVVVLCCVAISTYLGESKSSPAVAVDTPITSPDTTTPTNPTPVFSTPQPVVPTTPTPTPVVAQTPPVITQKQYTSIYKDGTYTATGSYMSPGGEDQVAVTLTLANDIITSITITPTAGDRTSSKYQSRFVAGYKQYVVGKNIASVSLTNVSGSSLTPIGFDNALTQIKAQAKA